MATERKPSRDVAQSTPNLWYIAVAKSGNAAPTFDVLISASVSAERAVYLPRFE